jgi:putative ABC transport system permease protein
MLSDLLFRIRVLLRKKTVEQELEQELRFHLEHQHDQYMRRGLSGEEARRRARLAFGGLEQVKEECRQMRGVSFIETSVQDIRHAVRAWRQRPLFAAVAVLTLALGIGANTAIFSLMNAVLLRMLPADKPEELARVEGYFSYPMFRDLRQRNQVFSGLIARRTTPVSLVSTGRTERGVGELVSGNYFSTLGVQPILGRTFTDADDRVPMGHPVAVVSFHYWRQRLSADPAIVGKRIRINNYPFVVIGVAPRAFFGVEVGSAPDVWVPLMMQPQIFGLGHPSFNQSGWGWLDLLGRRAPGISEANAQAGLSVTFRQIVQEGNHKLFRKNPAEAAIHLAPGGKGFSRLRDQFENPLYLLMAVVALVLLIACANIANLLLARSAARSKEIALRLALGAGRIRLIRQLLTESTLLGLLGGSLGFVFSIWSVRLLLGFLPGDRLPIVLDARADLRLLGFALLISIATGILFGLVPAIQATRPDVSDSLKDKGADGGATLTRFGLRQALVVSQVALSLLLLVGAGLFLRSLRNAVAIDVGLNTESVLLASMNPEFNGYTPANAESFYRQLAARLRDLPGVQSVGMSESALLSGDYSNVGMVVPSGPVWAPGPDRGILMNTVEGDFFQAAGGAILRGRDFGPQDTASSPKVAIINETAARHFFDNDEALAKKVRLAGVDGVEIIGIVRDSKYRGVREETPRIAYKSFSQDERPSGERTVYIRTAGHPLALVSALRREVQTLDRDLPVYNVKTFAEQKSESLARERLIATLSGFFGVLALVLASIGLYGVMAYSVQRRAREIGIRMSLGAMRGSVVWIVLRDCLLMVGIGIALGAPVSIWLSRLVTSQLFGVAPGDPATIVVAALSLTVVAALAGYLPAYRASRIDPMTALRCG